MYVISLSNISIKTYFKKITRVKLKFASPQANTATLGLITIGQCGNHHIIIGKYQTPCIRPATFVNFKGKPT
jgi:hypothetical protein